MLPAYASAIGQTDWSSICFVNGDDVHVVFARIDQGILIARPWCVSVALFRSSHGWERGRAINVIWCTKPRPALHTEIKCWYLVPSALWICFSVRIIITRRNLPWIKREPRACPLRASEAHFCSVNPPHAFTSKWKCQCLWNELLAPRCGHA